MVMPRAKFEYDYEGIVKLSDWPYNRLMRDVSDGKLNAADLASVCVWLAANGQDWLRAAMSSKLLPDLFGLNGRSPEVNGNIQSQLAPELLKIVLLQSSKPRKKRAKKCGIKP